MAFLSDDGGETYNRCHCELGFYAALEFVSFALSLVQL